MAKQKRSRQSWWPVYALALIMIGLLLLAQYLAPSPSWRHFLEVGVLVVGYSLIGLWLERHPSLLLRRPSAKTNSPAVESPELEILSRLSSRVQVQFYVGSDPAIIYDMPEQATNNLPLNGHHLAKTTPSLPEEAAE